MYKTFPYFRLPPLYPNRNPDIKTKNAIWKEYKKDLPTNITQGISIPKGKECPATTKMHPTI